MSQAQERRIQYATYGDDALQASGSLRQAAHQVNPTGSDFIDGVISGLAWSGGRITYAFPDSKSDYGYTGEKGQGFGEVGSKIKAAAAFGLDTAFGNKANDGFAVEGFTKLIVNKGGDAGSTIRYAESNAADPTAYAYYPGSSERSGDVWIGQSQNHYSNAVPGNYEWATILHETGHALGLKHGHEFGGGNGPIPSQWDTLEYSIMTYRSFVKAPLTGYTNENFGYPQTYMMADIAALQHMYGANFSVNSGSTVYSWRPDSGNTFVNGQVAIRAGGNQIFATIWDGGGRHDEYDLSAYSSNLYVDLRPGAYSTFKSAQLADLDAFSANKNRIADGNIYNALQYKGDNRSLIEDATGGSGNDFLVGNDTANILTGRMGNDRLYGGKGNDTYSGGGGKDVFVFEKTFDHDRIAQFDAADKIDLTGYNFASFNAVLNRASNDDGDVLINFGQGDTLRIDNHRVGQLTASDFIL